MNVCSKMRCSNLSLCSQAEGGASEEEYSTLLHRSGSQKPSLSPQADSHGDYSQLNAVRVKRTRVV